MQLMTTREAAEFLKVSRSFLYQSTRSGTVPAMKMGRSWRYSKEELERWIVEKIKQREE